MNIVSISWVRNEGDILEEFVRHHCTLVDCMVIINHRSADNSLEILESLAKEGLPIEIRHDPSILHRQSEALSALLHDVRRRYAPDWILPLDADEFIIPPGHQSLKDVLAQHAQDRLWRLPCKGYVPTPQDDLAERHILQRIQHRRSREEIPWHKICIPTAILKGDAWKVGYGNHHLLGSDNKALAATDMQGIFLAHFPIRSPQQIATKVFCGWLSYVADSSRMEGATFQWKALFDVLKHGELPSREALQSLAMEYASSTQWEAVRRNMGIEQSLAQFAVSATPGTAHLQHAPLQFCYPQLYSHVPKNPWVLLADMAEELAKLHAAHTKTIGTLFPRRSSILSNLQTFFKLQPRMAQRHPAAHGR